MISNIHANNARSPIGEEMHIHYAKGVFHAMRQRCNPKDRIYTGASLCEEWSKPRAAGFESFYEWAVYEAGYSDGYQLDKDILFPGNNLYAPHTCAFIPQYMNKLFTNCGGTKRVHAKPKPARTLPLGVQINYYRKNGNPSYTSQCRSLGKQATLGSFRTAMEAHVAWQHAKIAAIHECIDLYQMEDVHSVDIIQALLGRIDQLWKDIDEGKETTLLQ
ncbi:HNH endonuclease [Pseudomonas phage vB_PaeM_MAG1]|uniref:AP2 domain protein n=1 Tax=Pseudomonas phage vB_PaeM_MAG1 TaxID=1639815 RepID=A0A172CPA2_9CAUD|nr:HNH endonuclease [Pseudomonas phage vB_PaeM_MAG1]YP_009287469.1 HNH endonuclease [Pseudomonas phage vB_PaeM_MAG1]ALA11981.1 hypothetical protein vB_PaeM_MAG1_001 [Pseudomonas phage vB_PaeM_MAG1]ALA12153.1 hypothetical protein vB_PaeM_MAG1_187 [Pseudomonas phage vB_PaeM_MAG1]